MSSQEKHLCKSKDHKSSSLTHMPTKVTARKEKFTLQIEPDMTFCVADQRR